VISVIDLRTRFGMPAAPDGTNLHHRRRDQARVAPAEHRRHRRPRLGSAHIPGDKIEDAPSFGTSVDTSFILAWASSAAGENIA